MIVVFTGLPGSGKSVETAQQAMRLLRRNVRWYKRTGIVRCVASNIKFSKEVEKKYQAHIRYWDDPLELVLMKDVDVIWDEIATHLDSTQWAILPMSVRRFLQQHRKLGIDIYGNTQSFKTIDVSMRRLVERLYYLQKIVGSRSPAPTRPPVRFVWGVGIRRNVDPDSFEGEKVDYVYKGWSIYFLSRDVCNVFDTGQLIQVGKYPPLRHMVRECEDHLCKFVRVVHQ